VLLVCLFFNADSPEHRMPADKKGAGEKKKFSRLITLKLCK